MNMRDERKKMKVDLSTEEKKMEKLERENNKVVVKCTDLKKS